MSTRNPRGECELKVCGRTYTVRPTFQVVSAIEAATGKGAVALGASILGLECPLNDLAQAVYQAVKPLGGPSLAEVGDDIMEHGYKEFMAVGEMLFRTFRGNREAMQEAAESPPPKVTQQG